MKKLLILGLVIASVLACDSTRKGEAGKDVAEAKQSHYLEVLNQGGMGGREKASNTVITTQQELVKLYSELHWDNVPHVDFNKYNVIALFMGQKSSGGYSISISGYEIKGDTAKVKIITKTPDGMVITALTQPYYVAAITKTNKVVFE